MSNLEVPTWDSLTQYQKNRILSTNFWRIVNSIPIIEVPNSVKWYHEEFDYYKNKAEAILENKKLISDANNKS